jgi:ABC-2 type transport system permease protein
MFAYIFGGAISGSVADYLPIIIPGILAQTALTACMATGIQLREDMDKGVFDRFKSLPIARIAPLAGPMVADLLRYTITTVLTHSSGGRRKTRPAGAAGPASRMKKYPSMLEPKSMVSAARKNQIAMVEVRRGTG